ncbi:MAG: 4Fe-4S dicluster domain-containing protein [Anaerolineae bacterium]|nr:4Fe-4S dicluster domain-containing protein [Anaerolineae bacterium]
MDNITEAIRQQARALLENQEVDVVIGYQGGWGDQVITPCFITQSSDADKLVYTVQCTHNLAKYLVGREGYLTSRFRPVDAPVRVALVAGPAALRTIVGLIKEYQFERKDLVILGIVDGTPVGLEPDIEVGRIEVDSQAQQDLQAQIHELESMSLSERAAWWDNEFSKCIRCYACRQVCPFCYCEQCIADENQPQWIDKSPSRANNTAWNLIRAYHLVGRCTGCGECDRVCPVKIPLRLINHKMVVEIKEAFGYVSGVDADQEPALAAFQPGDVVPFIR